jgi:formylglycine-generating enzyme required for sulfatase activity
MKTTFFVCLLLVVLFISFESTAQIREKVTIERKAAPGTAPDSKFVSVQVEWTGDKRVNIVIDGSSYTFKAGQLRVLQLRPNIPLEIFIDRPGRRLAANELLLIDSSGGNLVINIQDDKAVFTYTTPADTEQIIREISLNMIAVQGGTFSMGFTSDQGEEYQYDEKPVHQVTLSDFSIGKYEVTQAQWRAVMGTNPSYFRYCETCPVEMVSWLDIQDFLSKLNSLTGKNYRLPTEAEWEYAARGGNRSKGYKFSGSNSVDTVGWYWNNSGEKTQPVGRKAPNELGIYDMTGNVFEWCQDWYGDYRSSSQTNPHGASSGFTRVIRGGCWNNTASNMRVSNRGGNSPRGRYTDVGFRLAL